MGLATYILESNDNFLSFQFTSVGKKGDIQKNIQFQRTHTFGLFNLAFGDLDSLNGRINDLIVSDNGDTDIALATVVNALYLFFVHYPDASVYIKGSTPSRTRLYQMRINQFIKEAQGDFLIFGQLGDGYQLFKADDQYVSFLVKRKIIKFDT